jgi:nucleoside-diphosphate-sugar epimerase
METVWVAGGAGFIGSHLCAELLSRNYAVVCLDNFITSSKQNIDPLLSNNNFTLCEQDICAITEVGTLPTPNYIFHMASPASPNAKSPRSYIAYPIETLLVNSQGTHNLLSIAHTTGARLLFASTSEIYGDPAISPQPESYWGNVNPHGIRSVYDEAKRFGEAIVMAYVRKYGVDGRIVRIFNTYGPNMQVDDGRVVSNFINQALHNLPLTIYGDGNQTRSFCYVSDLVAGLLSFMFTDNLKGEVINIGNPNEKKIVAFATIVKDITQTSSAIACEALPEDDPKQRCPDITKAKQLLNWEPKVSLEEGLQKTIDYFKQL